ncbi:MAG: hypothetical protein K9N46_07910 [Candidatus Marinimicrobia bacterium]|nr:hypothetical protein [Candidatus Neomarinimicrobiota bacterium]MCF7828731.1 hypothetical protein [Candidatus Neomarinimicrobiota bacterium]MCF7880648.1 hypothetical protein [Candidatus Neomarinimicrobiota bacterium]
MSSINYIIPAVLSFATAVITTPLVMKFARKKGFIAEPTADRWHSKPTALLGGIAIFLSIVIGFSYAGLFNKMPLGIFAGGLLIFISGIFDDIKGVKPYVKTIIQIIAAGLVILSGIVVGKGLLPQIISLPVTLLWIVGLTNAINLLDNMDGLSSGISGIIGIFLGVIFIMNNQPTPAILAFVISGACLGFLVYNFNPAKIFMGDSGSLLLGFLLASVSLIGTIEVKSQVMLSLGIPVLLMALPIFDTTLVTLNRKFFGRPISQGGKDHSSHRLISLGYSERQVALIMYGFTAIGGIIAIGLMYLELSISMLLLLVTGILFIGAGAFFTRIKVYSKQEYNSILRSNGEKTPNTIVNTVLMYKRRIAEIIVDAIIVIYSVYAALWLQFGGLTPEFVEPYMMQFIPIFVPFVLVVFYGFGFYKDIWRYVTISDVTKILGAVATVVAVLTILKFTLNILQIQFTTILIFGMLLFLLISGFRVSERIVADLLRGHSLSSGNKKNILFIGAGDTGNLAIREINQNQELNLNPIGFIDDDPTKLGAKINGVPVFGNLNKLEDIVEKHNVDEIIISITNIEDELLHKIYDKCKSTGKPIKRAQIKLDQEITTNGLK